MRLTMNPLAVRGTYTSTEREITSRAAAQTARTEICMWPGYATTPLIGLSEIARELNVSEVMIKDESSRLRLDSFKSLGGAYAAMRRVRKLPDPRAVTLCCATEGNHGRSVAFAARTLGCSAVIFMHENASPHKVLAIQALGARVVRTKGNYDDSVLAARETALEQNWLLISDISDHTDPSVYHVMQGYGVMVLELFEQTENRRPPTHVFLQGGVGGLAAGVIGVFADAMGATRPTFIIVEPDSAACLMESALRFAPAKIHGDLRTKMQMLACGTASPAAWPILARRADAFLAIDDDSAVLAAERLSRSETDRSALDTSVTGAAGLAGLIELVRTQPSVARLLGLNAESCVLVFGTEAAPPATSL